MAEGFLVKRRPRFLNLVLGNEAASHKILILTDRICPSYFLMLHFNLAALISTGHDFCCYVVSSAELKLCLVEDSVYWNFIHFLQSTSFATIIFCRYRQPLPGFTFDLILAKNAPILYFIDDLLWQSESCGPTQLSRQIEYKKTPEQHVSAYLAHANMIYCSTHSLAEQVHLSFPIKDTRTLIYPPYLNHMFTSVVPQNPDGKIRIGYQASKAHQGDLDSIVDVLEKVLTNYPQVRFELMGTIKTPDRLSKFPTQVTHRKLFKDYRSFFKSFRYYNWDIGLAPLEATLFNSVKSPVKFFEYTLAGIATLASDNSVYTPYVVDGRNGFLASSPADWQAKLEILIQEASIRRELQTNAAQTCITSNSIYKTSTGLLSHLSDFGAIPWSEPRSGIDRVKTFFGLSRC